tara:strand:+ start:695 stop:955 length:261 start_codon:yes stop_codon:yes gene_type:complete
MQKDEAVKKAVEMRKVSETKEESKKVEEKYITKEEIKSLIQNLQIQLQNLQNEVNQKQTMLVKTQGAIEVANAQLQGLEDDSKPTD